MVDRKSPRESTAQVREDHYSLQDRRKRSVMWHYALATSDSYQGRRKALYGIWYHPWWPSGCCIPARVRSAESTPRGGRVGARCASFSRYRPLQICLKQVSFSSPAHECHGDNVYRRNQLFIEHSLRSLALFFYRGQSSSHTIARFRHKHFCASIKRETPRRANFRISLEGFRSGNRDTIPWEWKIPYAPVHGSK